MYHASLYYNMRAQLCVTAPARTGVSAAGPSSAPHAHSTQHRAGSTNLTRKQHMFPFENNSQVAHLPSAKYRDPALFSLGWR
jgi:hypothetical protein